MKLFLDTSVVLAAIGSPDGASREIFNQAEKQAWQLIVTPYVLSEIEANICNFTDEAQSNWPNFRKNLIVQKDILTIDRPAVFGPTKDRPILFGALAWADVLLTLNQQDFGNLIDRTFYGLKVLRPGTFLLEERSCGRLPEQEN